jgi:hypothetical protein
MVTAASSSPASRIKPYCKALTRGSLGADIDGRSAEGKFLRRIETELVEQLGEPTFSQMLAIRRIARLSLQAEFLDAKMSSGDWTPHDGRTASGINNAVLRALKDIGLKSKGAEKAVPTLAEIAARHAKAAGGRLGMRPFVSMRQALGDPDLFGAILAGESWAAWRVVLIAIVGEELTAEERIIFEGLTGREREPLEPVEEFWGVIGRRSGKTRQLPSWRPISPLSAIMTPSWRRASGRHCRSSRRASGRPARRCNI